MKDNTAYKKKRLMDIVSQNSNGRDINLDLATKSYVIDRNIDSFLSYLTVHCQNIYNKALEYEEGVNNPPIWCNEIHYFFVSNQFKLARHFLCIINDDNAFYFKNYVLALKYILLGNKDLAEKYIILAKEKHKTPKSLNAFINLLHSIILEPETIVDNVPETIKSYKNLSKEGNHFGDLNNNWFSYWIVGLLKLTHYLNIKLPYAINYVEAPTDLQSYNVLKDNFNAIKKYNGFKNRLPLIINRLEPQAKKIKLHKSFSHKDIKILRNLIISQYLINNDISSFREGFSEIAKISNDLKDALLSKNLQLIHEVAQNTADVVEGKGSASIERFMYQSLKELVLNSSFIEIWTRRFKNHMIRRKSRDNLPILWFSECLCAISELDLTNIKKHRKKLVKYYDNFNIISINDGYPELLLILDSLLELKLIKI